jgi:hypothetical protein
LQKEGIIQAVPSKAIDFLLENKLEKLSEFEIAFLYDGFYNLLNSTDHIDNDLLQTYNFVEQSWAFKAKQNGARLTKDHFGKTLH